MVVKNKVPTWFLSAKILLIFFNMLIVDPNELQPKQVPPLPIAKLIKIQEPVWREGAKTRKGECPLVFLCSRELSTSFLPIQPLFERCDPGTFPRQCPRCR